MRRLKILDYAAYLALRIFICIIQATTIETCHRICKTLAWIAHDIFRVRRKVVDENISHVFPNWSSAQRNQLALRMWEHLFLMVCELAHIPRKLHETNWRKYVRVADREAIVGAFLDRRPFIIASGHYGNFEMGAQITGLLGFKTYTLARQLDNLYLHRWVNAYRGANGQYTLTSWGASNIVAELLDAGQTIVLLGDQFGGPKGCWVNFLGRPASYFKSVALFPLTAKAPMAVIRTRRTGGPMQFEIAAQGLLDPETDEIGGIKPVIEWYNDRLEEMVGVDPSQYWWLHRRWKGDPAIRRRRKRTKPKAA